MIPLFRLSLPLLAATLLPVTAAAVEAAHDHNHGASAGASSSPAQPGTPGATATATAAPATTDDGRIDRQLQRMRDLHARIAAAKSPAERQRHMVDNHRLLQEAMELLRTLPPAPDMAMMHHGDGAAAPAMPGGQHGTPGAMRGEPSAADGRKRMGEKPMQQCQEMHAAQARHMQLMHAVLQALVDQQSAATGK